VKYNLVNGHLLFSIVSLRGLIPVCVHSFFFPVNMVTTMILLEHILVVAMTVVVEPLITFAAAVA
jgi:hypothetical protein